MTYKEIYQLLKILRTELTYNFAPDGCKIISFVIKNMSDNIYTNTTGRLMHGLQKELFVIERSNIVCYNVQIMNG